MSEQKDEQQELVKRCLAYLESAYDLMMEHRVLYPEDAEVERAIRDAVLSLGGRLPVKITAILGGGDWAGASVEHLIIPEGMDLAEEEARRDKWYESVYLPAFLAGKKPKFLSLRGWLIERGARVPTDDELEIYDTL